MNKRKKKTTITKAILTDNGKVMIAQPNGKAKPAADQSDWKSLAVLTDDQIDYTDSPELDDRFWATTKLVPPQTKDRVTMRVDHDILDWLKQYGAGYQTKINAILRHYMERR